mgnify:CR=1 FL=1
MFDSCLIYRIVHEEALNSSEFEQVEVSKDHSIENSELHILKVQ